MSKVSNEITERPVKLHIQRLILANHKTIKANMLDDVEVCIMRLLGEWPARQCTAKNWASYFCLTANVINKRLLRMEKMGYVKSTPGAGTLRFWSKVDGF